MFILFAAIFDAVSIQSKAKYLSKVATIHDCERVYSQGMNQTYLAFVVAHPEKLGLIRHVEEEDVVPRIVVKPPEIVPL
jgi:hypothetical protein